MNLAFALFKSARTKLTNKFSSRSVFLGKEEWWIGWAKIEGYRNVRNILAQSDKIKLEKREQAVKDIVVCFVGVSTRRRRSHKNAMLKVADRRFGSMQMV
jgi:hypothetical protein